MIDPRPATNIHVRSSREISKVSGNTSTRVKVICDLSNRAKQINSTHDVSNFIVVLVVNSWPALSIPWHSPGSV